MEILKRGDKADLCFYGKCERCGTIGCWQIKEVTKYFLACCPICDAPVVVAEEGTKSARGILKELNGD